MKNLNSVILAIFILIPMFVGAQVSEITVRFANPTFDCVNKTYCVDVEYSSDSAADSLYGNNVRFFYNSEQLDFIDFRDIVTNYGVTRVPSKSEGVSTSGQDLFNFPAGEAAVWINGAVELTNTSSGLPISQGGWTKYFEACFDVVGNPTGVDDFCPEIIWDLEADRNDGGFLPGNDGVVITLKNGNVSRVANESAEHFNWDYSGNGTMPYGDYSQSTGGCITETCLVCNVPNSVPPVRQP